MTKIDPADMEIIDKYWHQDLETELAYVLKDTSNSSDSVDVKVRETQNKRIKLCTAGHENWDVRSNRKKCYQQHKPIPIVNDEIRQTANKHNCDHQATCT